MYVLSILILLSFLSCNSSDRVAEAQKKHTSSLHRDLLSAGIQPEAVQLLLLAFKEEGVLEAHVRSGPDLDFQLFKTYPICGRSGGPGPKRRSGDLQVPEGFYHINRFNPNSRFHLSLGINYPNQADRLLGDAKDPGSDIFIHGGCATIGCLPLGNDAVSELYVLALMAREKKRAPIPVYIFPCRMEGKECSDLLQAKENTALRLFWQEMKTGYDLFHKQRRPLRFTVDTKGAYRFS